MTTLVAYDPGETTGYSWWGYDVDVPLYILSAGQINGGLEGFLKHAPLEADIVVCESFILDGRTPNPNLTPLKIEGALEALKERTGYELHFQRNNFKKHVSDQLLKRYDLWMPSYPHAMDSMRHALAYMKTSMHMPTLKQYFVLD